MQNWVAVASALTVIRLGPWFLLLGVGLVLLVTGRPLPLAVRPGIRAGWRVRLAGFVYGLIGLGYTSLVLQAGGIYWDAVVGSYIGLGVTIWYMTRHAGSAAT